jgi:hypothetical protein
MTTFNDLPTEIRLMIWELIDPRVITIKNCTSHKHSLLTFGSDVLEKLPIQLSICRESLHLALAKYQSTFAA